MSNKEASKKYRQLHPERRKATTKKWRDNNQEQIKGYNKIYNEINIEKRKQYIETYKAKHPRVHLRNHLRNKYGLELETYDLMVMDQDNKCKICDKEEKENHRLSVDHCHTTGKVRGLLCKNCNKALGLFLDSKELLVSAENYLSTHG